MSKGVIRPRHGEKNQTVVLANNVFLHLQFLGQPGAATELADLL